jgi:monoamine oxidase
MEDFIDDYDLLVKKFKTIKEDITVAEFIDRHFQGEEFAGMRESLTNYVEGYYAADIDKASTLALYRELTTADDEQYRIEGGYKKLVDYLESKCKLNGVQFFLSEEIKKISWKKGHVVFHTARHNYVGGKAVLSLPIGVLRSAIQFDPPLNDKIEAANKLGYGAVIKIVFEFNEKFWFDKKNYDGTDLSEMSFIFSTERVPTWWTQYPNKQATLTGWLAGRRAEELKSFTDDEIKEIAVKSLCKIFNLEIDVLVKELKAWQIFNWQNDPFSLGAYSFEVVGGEKAMEIVREPVEDTLYFAGEGLYAGSEIGTVEAGLVTGREVSKVLMTSDQF